MRPILKMLAVSEPASMTDVVGSSKGEVCGGASVTGASTPLAERQEELHHEFDPLLQELAQLAVGGNQPHFLG